MEDACEEYYTGRQERFLAMDKELIVEKILVFLYYSIVAQIVVTKAAFKFLDLL